MGAPTLFGRLPGPQKNVIRSSSDVKVVAQHPLQGEAGADEGVIGITWETCGPAVVPEHKGVCRPGRQAKAQACGRGEGDGGWHGVQPDGSWSACTGAKAGPDSGAFKRGQGGG
jgi:hypothetical protein